MERLTIEEVQQIKDDWNDPYMGKPNNFWENRINSLFDTIEAQQQEIRLLSMEIAELRESNQALKAYAENADADKDEQAGRIMRLEEALKKIANPILHMQKEAKSVGCVLDGAMAIRLSEDPHYYRKIAQKAIDALLGGKEK